jgi:hypothetical protein
MKLTFLKNLKLKQMKKLLLVFTVAAFLTACGGGDSTSTETTPTDSAAITTPAPAPVDSAAVTAPAQDTTKANADSAK